MNDTLPYMSLSNASLVDVVRLIRSENVGPITFYNLIEYYGSVEHALLRIPDMAKRGGGKRPIKLCSEADAKAEIDATHAFGAKMVCYGHKDYPALLAQTRDAPPVISVLGDPSLWATRPSIGVVGARNASANGCRFAQHTAKDLGEANIIITSGLARGIDTYAHNGALETGTVAVIAGGIDSIYPAENEPLYRKIAEQGAIISEAPFGTAPLNRHFPRRNRIISGMSQGILVVEASKKSGSLITANMALDQGRDIFAVPGSPMDPRCSGTNYLIKQGATLVESAEDITQAMEEGFGTAAQALPPTPLGFAEANAPYEVNHEQAHQKVDEYLSAVPLLIDDLAEQTNIPISTLSIILLEKEVAGMIERHLGGRISLVYNP